jgi:hypothetical protein
MALGPGSDSRCPAETLRKRAMRAIDRLHAYVEVREDEARFAEWRARHPVLALTAREEMELAILWVAAVTASAYRSAASCERRREGGVDGRLAVEMDEVRQGCE